MIERFRGALAGMAAGDALGTTLEFRSPGTFEPITGIVGGCPFGLEPGQWTDDTSMAMCLAESLVECGGFDAGDQMRRYLRWYREGHWSPTGACFDIGNTVGGALQAFEKTGEPFSGTAAAHSAGNGSLMRLAPVPLAFAADPTASIARSGESSRTTHGETRCVDACRYFAGLIVGALRGETKEVLLPAGAAYHPGRGRWPASELHPEIHAVASGSYRDRRPPDIRGTGFVVHALEAALWAFAASDTFEEGALMAVNLGDDADTTGAIFGQLAGAYCGHEQIPARWREVLAMHDRIVEMAGRLHALCERGAVQ